MIGDFFSFLDGLARFIGWAAIIYWIIWLVSRHLEERRLLEEAQNDRDDRLAFELWLEESNSDRYKKYRDLKFRYSLMPENVHWHSVALECGVSRLEILEDRKGISK